MRAWGCVAVVVAVGLALGLASGADAAGGMCGAPAGPVLLVLVPSPERVALAAEGLSSSPALVRAPDTIVFADGRVVTSDLAAASSHLNALGWAERPIEIAGAGTSRRASPEDPSRPKPRRRG